MSSCYIFVGFTLVLTRYANADFTQMLTLHWCWHNITADSILMLIRYACADFLLVLMPTQNSRADFTMILERYVHNDFTLTLYRYTHNDFTLMLTRNSHAEFTLMLYRYAHKTLHWYCIDTRIMTLHSCLLYLDADFALKLTRYSHVDRALMLTVHLCWRNTHAHSLHSCLLDTLMLTLHWC